MKILPYASASVFLTNAVLLLSPIAAMSEEDAFFHLAGSRPYRPPAETVETLKRIEIGTGGDQTILATVFRPREKSEHPRPGIVFIHGGGWRSGQTYNTFGAWLAERGYVVASIGYRLSTEAKWPAQIEDCKLGVRWLRANAEKYGVDPNRIGTYGTSAGGHLAACLGIMQDSPELEGTGGWEGTSSRVSAVVALSPPADLTADWLPGSPPPQWVEDLLGVPRDSNPELWKQASPAQNVQPGTPPFFIAHGENDTHVPFASQGEKLRDALTAAGTTVEWIPVKNGQHGFFVDPSTPESTIEPTREEIMRRLLEFLDTHLKKIHTHTLIHKSFLNRQTIPVETPLRLRLWAKRLSGGSNYTLGESFEKIAITDNWQEYAIDLLPSTPVSLGFGSGADNPDGIAAIAGAAIYDEFAGDLLPDLKQLFADENGAHGTMPLKLPSAIEARGRLRPFPTNNMGKKRTSQYLIGQGWQHLAITIKNGLTTPYINGIPIYEATQAGWKPKTPGGSPIGLHRTALPFSPGRFTLPPTATTRFGALFPRVASMRAYGCRMGMILPHTKNNFGTTSTPCGLLIPRFGSQWQPPCPGLRPMPRSKPRRSGKHGMTTFGLISQT